ncbi:MAG: hypothetical protein JWL70_938 [Acidimicrobiia bacterium]|nr:hypothetical protein [Acidimicrobiia bacterium]
MTRPQPPVNPVSAPYWEAAARHELMLQRCGSCQRYIFFPRPTCPNCGGADLRWTPVSGRGIVHTFTVARRATHPGMADFVPYVIALVELAEGPRLTTNLVDVDPDDVTVGLAVQVTFLDQPDGVTLPVFAPAGPPADR